MYLTALSDPVASLVGRLDIIHQVVSAELCSVLYCASGSSIGILLTSFVSVPLAAQRTHIAFGLYVPHCVSFGQTMLGVWLKVVGALYLSSIIPQTFDQRREQP